MPLYGESGYGSGRYGLADNGPIYTLTLGYYLALLTSQYRPPLAPNLNAFLLDLLQPADDLTTLLSMFTQSFDLSYAVGVQLDVLGVIIGQGRTVGFQPSGGVSPVLDDATYRILLLARIAQNQWDGKIDSLQSIWRQLFPFGRIYIQDHQNMSATVFPTGTFSSILQDLITNGYIVPRPEGVLYEYVFGTLPLFGFDRNDSFIAGFDVGHWS
jgi:Protein of unknown function (DUF2612)